MKKISLAELEEMSKENEEELKEVHEYGKDVVNNISNRHAELNDTLNDMMDKINTPLENISLDIEDDLSSEKKTMEECDNLSDELDDLLNSL